MCKYVQFVSIYFLTFLAALASSTSSAKQYAAVCQKWGHPKVLHVEEVDKPLPCLSDEVLVKVVAAGINPVETYIRSGQYPNLPELPAILGTEVCGVVEEVGNNVTHVKVGDRVYGKPVLGTGGYSQFAKCKSIDIYHLPEKLSFIEGAAMYVSYFTAFRALALKAKMKPGEYVFIHGATGSVGTAAVQLAKAHGLTVVGSCSTDEGKEYILQIGADHAINYKDMGAYDEALRLIGGRKFDIVIEPIANLMLANDLSLINMRGRICVVGSRGQIHVNPRGFMQTEAQIYGVSLLSQTPREGRYTAEVLSQGVKDGWLKPLVHKRYLLNELPEAHKAMKESGTRFGKLVISNIDEFDPNRLQTLRTTVNVYYVPPFKEDSYY